MHILALETTGARASVAIIDGGGRVTELVSDGAMNHLRSLLPAVSQLLEKCKLTIDDLTAIAASRGPGSFTGIRIGVSTARALAQAADKPVIGVPTLQTFAYQLPEALEGGAAGTGGGAAALRDAAAFACPIFDARRSQVYGGAYRLAADGRVEELAAGGAYALKDYLALLLAGPAGRGGLPVFFGDGIGPYGEAVRRWAAAQNRTIAFAPEPCRLQSAAAAAKLALALWRQGAAAPYEALHPDYMRAAEAQRRLEAGSLPRADETRAARAPENRPGRQGQTRGKQGRRPADGDGGGPDA